MSLPTLRTFSCSSRRAVTALSKPVTATLVTAALVAGTVVAGTVVTGALVLTLGAGEAAAAAPPTVSSLLAAAKAAIAKEGAVHLEVDSKSTTSANNEKVVADLGKKSGTESISTGADAVTIVVTPAYGYVSGNPGGLAKIVGLTSAEVKKVGRKWITLKAGSSQYTSIATDIRISSVQTVLPQAKGTTLSVDTALPVHLYVLSWTTAASSSNPKLSSTITFPVAGATLPIQEVTTAKGSKETVTLSKWGEFVNIVSPPLSQTIPYSKVSG
ncbi:MAG: hypothetical protein ACLP7F_06270 [Acidimicrobiales bacterium]